MSQALPLLVAQLTDIHLFATPQQELVGFPTSESFLAVLQTLKELQPSPDLLLLTGDLSQDHTKESYQHLQQLISPLGIPTYWLPGNHDSLPFMDEVLTKFPFLPEKSFQQGNWNFILLNSGVPGYVHGYLSGSTLEWLDRQLSQLPPQPTLVSLHHPPFLVNSEWLDSSTLQNPEELFTVLARYPQVKLVLFGHIHQEFDREFQGIRYLASPSTCIQFKPKSEKFGLDVVEPGFRVLKLYPDGKVETRVERVAFAGRFDLAAKGY
ncbi:3',5'-cyclic-AMP phosphodiesterase [Ancylothrix sp. C2]|uniref:3',5'-cyclic-AMP phosphodiesterase n=1 Tax=Ancylothrix sp. D3o TaxID=2953691 RepID=UPI0021BB61F2|nr:3',5'-cyclic-AMP phosphodiesterase [Ancylothrix sp. D3o]MCT7951616.1 3',5'-cyclic-AMP phosphodiesterase [Ancylothrix sp. D3o]